MLSDHPFKDRPPLYEGTHKGIRWCIVRAPVSSVLNGYACIPDGVTINVDTLEVHGGISYGNGDCTGWIGFDTAHAGDSWDLDELREKVGLHITAAGEMFQQQERSMWSGAPWEKTWTVDLLKAECERLCAQIAARANWASLIHDHVDCGEW